MFTRSEIEFKNRACMAQMKLRVVVFSMAVALPVWLGVTLLQKMGYALSAGLAERAIGCGLLLIYVVGVLAIIRRTQIDHEMFCPECKGLLGPELRHVSKDGKCTRCDGQVVRK